MKYTMIAICFLMLGFTLGAKYAEPVVKDLCMPVCVELFEQMAC